MEITVSQMQGSVPVTVLHLNGELDSSTYQAFEASAKQAVAGGAKNLLIDMTYVPYMSSAGMRTLTILVNLLHNHAELKAIDKGISDGSTQSPHLKLVGVSPHVMEALKMAGFDMYLAIYKDTPSAVAAF